MTVKKANAVTEMGMTRDEVDAAILLGLRSLQERMGGCNGAGRSLDDDLEDYFEVNGLSVPTVDQIDDLCEEFNCGNLGVSVTR